MIDDRPDDSDAVWVSEYAMYCAELDETDEINRLLSEAERERNN